MASILSASISMTVGIESCSASLRTIPHRVSVDSLPWHGTRSSDLIGVSLPGARNPAITEATTLGVTAAFLGGRHEKRPAAARGFSRSRSRDQLVSGRNRGRSPPVEAIVDPDLCGLNFLLDTKDILTADITVRIDELQVLAAKTIEIVFGEDRPIGQEGPFNAAANGPAGAGLAGGLMVVFAVEDIICLSHPSAAALDVEQRSTAPAGPSDSAGDAPEPIRPRAKRLVFFKAKPG